MVFEQERAASKEKDNKVKVRPAAGDPQTKSVRLAGARGENGAGEVSDSMFNGSHASSDIVFQLEGTSKVLWT